MFLIWIGILNKKSKKLVLRKKLAFLIKIDIGIGIPDKDSKEFIFPMMIDIPDKNPKELVFLITNFIPDKHSK